MKRVIAMLLACMLLFTACGPAGSSSEDSSKPAEPTVQLPAEGDIALPSPVVADTLLAIFDENREVDELYPTPCGADFQMHFADFVIVDGVIRAYYIAKDDQGRPVTGLAVSTDGRYFEDKGIVVSCDTDYDCGYAAFAGIVYHEGVTYLTYECLGDGDSSQDIALATSTDGYHFEKQGVILKEEDCPQWCSANVGTPDLVYADGMWYLFFHGYDGTDCQIGVAYGKSLNELTVYPTPILPTSDDPSQPDSGTTGRRDIVYLDGWYYMVYEVSTDKVGADFGGSYWTHMFARSQDLLHWENRAPLVTKDSPGMGYDGPNWLIDGDHIYVYYRTGGNITCRVELKVKEMEAE